MTLPSKSGLVTILKKYLEVYPNESQRQISIAAYFERNESHQLYTRKNFDGHLTASAFVLDRQKRCLLLIQHRSLGKWLQPGGHIDASDHSILAAAYREVEEETGISKDHLHLIQEDSKVPFDIDSHLIPENPKKVEDSHYHHDIRFLFQYTGENDVIINIEESEDYKWIPLTDLESDSIFGNMVTKIRDSF